MTQELDATAASTDSGQTAAAGSATVGQALRGLRLARGWSLDEVSSRIKFSTRQIQSLEDEQWDNLPKGVSLRGLVRSYARLLETDEAAIVASVENQVGSLATPSAVYRMPRTAPVAVTPRGEAHGGIPWGWLLVIVILLAVLVAYAVWQGWLSADWLPSWLSSENP